jgi:hypothetical protein
MEDQAEVIVNGERIAVLSAAVTELAVPAET